MAPFVMECIRMEKLEKEQFIQLGENNVLTHLAVRDNPFWHKFTTYCKVMDNLRLGDIHKPPVEIARMLNDNEWRPKMVKHLNNRRGRGKKAIEVGSHLSEEEKTATVLTHPETLILLKQALAEN